MMRKIISLIKTDFNTTFSISSLDYSFKNKKDRWKIIGLTVLLLSLLPSYYLLVKTLVNIYDTYTEIGQTSMFLLTGVLLAQIVVFLLGLLYVMSKYYFSNDLAQLVPLPIKPSYIIGSKFATLMVSEYLTSLPIVLPFILIYGIRGGQGLLYWIYSAFIILTLPIIPLVLASILIMLFMKFTNIGAKKDIIRLVSALIFIIAMVFFQVKINTMLQQALIGGQDFLINIVKDSNFFVKKLGILFPPSMWASLSLSNYIHSKGLLYLFLFISTSLISFVLMIYLSEKVFFDGLIGNIEVSSSKGKNTKPVSLEKLSKKKRPFYALAKKELIMLFKTPIYLLNSIGGVILLPLILIATITFSPDESMGMVMTFIENKPELITLGGTLFIVSLGVLNNIGTTTFSREGKNFWIQRTLPIKVKDQILGRVLASLLVQVLAIVVLLTSFSFIIKINISSILWISFLGILGSIATTQMGMIIDIIRPLLTWTNPQQAMKQNLNVLIGMALGSLYLGGIGYIVFKLIYTIKSYILFLSLGAVFIFSSIGFYIILKKLISKQFSILE